MTEDWAAVSLAINERMSELGLTQRELVERSQVSKAMIMEIRHNVAQRRRSTRTLEALSIALDWHPQHLDAVLKGQRIPEIGEPVVRSDEDMLGRLTAIEYRLEQILEHLSEVKHLREQVDELNHKLETIIQLLGKNEQGS